LGDLGLKEIGCHNDWIHLAQNSDQGQSIVNSVRNLKASKQVGEFLIGWVTVGFCKRT
jgi:hypothetical protein